MLVRDHYPSGVPSWVDTAQPDPDVAAAFYGDLFGWSFEDRMPGEVPGQYLIAQLEGHDVAAIGSQPDDTAPLPVWNTYIAVDSADGAAAAVLRAGGQVLQEPMDVAKAGRMAVASDPAGAVFCVWQAGTQTGARIVNAPGTWNFSNLETQDVEGSEAFYGAVFGWEARRIDMGGFEAIMWVVPGYGDYLTSLEPELRERQGSEGAPEGFADCVAWLNVMPDEVAAEVPAHWSVTFAVADADWTAQRAADKGGTVVVAPFDTGYGKAATLADPFGAVFTVNTYEPPTD